MHISYATKAKFVIHGVPALLLVTFALLGLSGVHALVSETPLPTSIGVTTDKSQYRAGQVVTALLFNNSNTSVFVQNNCPHEPLSVYRLEQNKWVRLHANANIAKCSGEERDYEIGSGRIIQVDYSYWPSLFDQAGSYRIAADFESYASEATADFTIVK